MKVYKFALIGCGMISKSHIPALKALKNAELIAVCDANSAKAQATAEETGLPAFTDAREMLEKLPEIDVCLITTPTFTHVSLIDLCAQFGKAVLCEKPIAMTRGEAEQVRAIVQRTGIPYMTAMVVRFWAGYVKLKEMMDAGEFGEIYMSYFSRCSEPQHWGNAWLYDPERGGGAMYDMLVHDVDFMEYMFGPAKRVFALASKDDTRCYQNVFASIEYENGIRGVAETSFTMKDGYPFSMYAKIMGSRATAEFRYQAGYSINDRGGATCTLNLWRSGKEPEYITVEQYDAYAREIAYFLDCLEHGRQPAVVTVEDSVNVMHTINAIEASADRGEAVALSDLPDRVYQPEPNAR